ncbi:unnamed protein product [Rotaria sp. Silwood1]|nr:unnamed protein product [Rotaria sp. Silwood1]
MASSMYLFSVLMISLIALTINLTHCSPANTKISDAIEHKITAEKIKSNNNDQKDSSKAKLSVEKASINKRAYPTEGILLGKRGYPTEGILLGKRGYPTEGILLGKRGYPTEGILLGKRNTRLSESESSEMADH